MPQKIAFITGGNRGLGFQTALDLGLDKKAGVKVVIGSRDLAQGKEALPNCGPRASTPMYFNSTLQRAQITKPPTIISIRIMGASIFS